MLERLISYWQSHSDAYFVTFEQAAATFRQRYPFAGSQRASSVGK
jgi:hypothetical protein